MQGRKVHECRMEKESRKKEKKYAPACELGLVVQQNEVASRRITRNGTEHRKYSAATWHAACASPGARGQNSAQTHACMKNTRHTDSKKQTCPCGARSRGKNSKKTSSIGCSSDPSMKSKNGRIGEANRQNKAQDRIEGASRKQHKVRVLGCRCSHWDG